MLLETRYFSWRAPWFSLSETSANGFTQKISSSLGKRSTRNKAGGAIIGT